MPAASGGQLWQGREGRKLGELELEGDCGDRGQAGQDGDGACCADAPKASTDRNSQNIDTSALDDKLFRGREEATTAESDCLPPLAPAATFVGSSCRGRAGAGASDVAVEEASERRRRFSSKSAATCASSCRCFAVSCRTCSSRLAMYAAFRARDAAAASRFCSRRLRFLASSSNPSRGEALRLRPVTVFVFVLTLLLGGRAVTARLRGRFEVRLSVSEEEEEEGEPGGVITGSLRDKRSSNSSCDMTCGTMKVRNRVPGCWELQQGCKRRITGAETCISATSLRENNLELPRSHDTRRPGRRLKSNFQKWHNHIL